MVAFTYQVPAYLLPTNTNLMIYHLLYATKTRKVL